MKGDVGDRGEKGDQGQKVRNPSYVACGLHV